jgi:hypothetical protein
MKAAIVVETGKTPIYGDFKEPTPANGEVQVTVSAAALSNVVKRALQAMRKSFEGGRPSIEKTCPKCKGTFTARDLRSERSNCISMNAYTKTP